MNQETQVPSVRFAPSRVEGLAEAEVVVWPDRIALLSAGQWVTHRFADIAEWPRPRWLWKVLYRCGIRPKWLPVGDRDWFHEPPDMFFRFYTVPPLEVCMPRDEVKEYGPRCHFDQVNQVLRAGGFNTYDLG